MNEWINVEDRLPKHEERILIYSKNDCIDLAEYLEPRNYPPYVKYPLFFVDDSCSFEIQEVSHWMPLPDAPK